MRHARFAVDGEHRLDGQGPLYMQVSRGSLVLHLSEHHRDGSRSRSASVGAEAAAPEPVTRKTSGHGSTEPPARICRVECGYARPTLSALRAATLVRAWRWCLPACYSTCIGESVGQGSSSEATARVASRSSEA